MTSASRMTKILLVILIVLATSSMSVQHLNAQGPTYEVAVLIIDDFSDPVTLSRAIAPDLEPRDDGLLPNVDYDVLGEDGLEGDLEEAIGYLHSAIEDLAEILNSDRHEDLENVFCATNLIDFKGTGFAKIDGASHLPIFGVSHGAVVHEVVTTVLQLNGYDHMGTPVAAQTGSPVYQIDKYANGQNGIVVVSVDTDGFTPQGVLDALNYARQETQDLLPEDDLQRFVVNMSFAVIPCESLPTIAAYEAFLLAAEIDGTTWGDYREVMDRVLSRAIQTIQVAAEDVDPSMIYEYEYSDSDLSSSTDTIVVAASGNAGVDYPFYPAAFDYVVSVSSSAEDALYTSTFPKALFSNAGEVMMPGIWPSASASVFDSQLPSELTVEGTSFAAPRLSAVLALYLVELNGVNYCMETCAVPSCTAAFGMTYINDWSSDLPLDQAITHACNDVFMNTVYSNLQPSP